LPDFSSRDRETIGQLNANLADWFRIGGVNRQRDMRESVSG
jgi:hypothetical protein